MVPPQTMTKYQLFTYKNTGIYITAKSVLKIYSLAVVVVLLLTQSVMGEVTIVVTKISWTCSLQNGVGLLVKNVTRWLFQRMFGYESHVDHNGRT